MSSRKGIIDVLRLRRITGSKEYRELRDIRTASDLQEFRERHLRALLLHAYKRVPYYRRILGEDRLIQNGSVDLSKFDQIPLLTKDLLRRFGDDLISADYTTRRWYYNTSGGSTGEPVRFMQDDTFQKRAAAMEYYYYKHMLDIEEPVAKRVILWGSERDIFEGGIGAKAKAVNWLTHVVFLNSFWMSQRDIERYIAKINSYQPELIRGYAASLFEVCRYAASKNLPLYSPKAVVSSAEALTDEMRQVIESGFNTTVYNFYGSREAAGLIGECSEGSMHIFSFLQHLEVLNDDNQAVKNGEEGRVVVTNLHNYSMPLIRYEIGDMAIQGDEVCPCGSILPTLKKVTGRVTDHFVTNNETLIHGEYFTHLFYFRDAIKRFQVIQEDYDRIKILLVLSNGLSETEKEDIEHKIRLAIGQCTVIWEIVDDIPKSPSGKYLYTKSLVRHSTK